MLIGIYMDGDGLPWGDVRVYDGKRSIVLIIISRFYD